MPSKSVARNRLRTALETQRKWASIFYWAFKNQPPITTRERAEMSITSLTGSVSVFMPASRSWSTDSIVYAVETFCVEACIHQEMRVIVTIHLDKVGPKHDLTVETKHEAVWLASHPPCMKKKAFIEARVTEWAWSVLRRELAPRRMARIKEELMAAAWAPARVEKWLAAGLDVEAL